MMTTLFKDSPSMLKLASEILNENIGNDTDLLRQLSEQIGVTVPTLKKIISLPEDFDPSTEKVERVLWYFNYKVIATEVEEEPTDAE